jgi:hypothetical protein
MHTFLDQLRARGFILNRHDIRGEGLALLAPARFSSGYSIRLRRTCNR